MGYFRTAFYMDGLELAYSLYDVERRGGGLVTEAVGLLVGWLFAMKKIARLQIRLSWGDGASRRVPRRTASARVRSLAEHLIHAATSSRARRAARGGEERRERDPSVVL